MPVTIKPNTHQANAISLGAAIPNAEALLKGSCFNEHERCAALLKSSFIDFNSENPIHSNGNGFVHGAIEAYNNHHNLVIRPEDIWLAILIQLTLFINANSELLRSKFVAFKGKKEFDIEFGTSRWSCDYAEYARITSLMLEDSIVDKELRVWMMPAFSTTTEADIAVASIVMMGAMKKYFGYTMRMACGLPSVTLLGERSDWEKILSRLEKLKDFGDEPAQWYKLLHPIVSRFVLSFDGPESPEILDFWNRIAHHDRGGSGPSYYSGWITAFCFWDDDGKSLYKLQDFSGFRSTLDKLTPQEKLAQWQKWHPEKQFRLEQLDWELMRYPVLILDGVQYHRVEDDKVPPGYVTVEVHVDDNGDEFEALLIAGSVGVRTSSSGNKAIDGVSVLDTLQAESGWWMIELTERNPAAEREKVTLAELERQRALVERFRRREL